MAVIEVQSESLPPDTNKKKGSNLTAVLEILLIEEILKYEGTVFGVIGTGALSNEKSQFGTSYQQI